MRHHRVTGGRRRTPENTHKKTGVRWRKKKNKGNFYRHDCTPTQHTSTPNTTTTQPQPHLRPLDAKHPHESVQPVILLLRPRPHSLRAPARRPRAAPTRRPERQHSGNTDTAGRHHHTTAPADAACPQYHGRRPSRRRITPLMQDAPRSGALRGGCRRRHRRSERGPVRRRHRGQRAAVVAVVVVVAVLRDRHAPAGADAHTAAAATRWAAGPRPRCYGPAAAAAHGSRRGGRAGGDAAAAAAAVVAGVVGRRGGGVGAVSAECPLPGALRRAAVVEVPRDLVPPAGA